jgi:hypothetical protein
MAAALQENLLGAQGPPSRPPARAASVVAPLLVFTVGAFVLAGTQVPPLAPPTVALASTKTTEFEDKANAKQADAEGEAKGAQLGAAEPTLPPIPEMLEGINQASLKNAAECLAVLLVPHKAAAGACEVDSSHSQHAFQLLVLVLGVFLLFLFAPFYLFPEACVAALVWKTFPVALEPFLPGISSAPSDTLEAMRHAVWSLVVVAGVLRLFVYIYDLGAKATRPSLVRALVSLAVSAILLGGLVVIAQH